jgi:DNA-binding transcriptional LysR family regulator
MACTRYAQSSDLRRSQTAQRAAMEMSSNETIKQAVMAGMGLSRVG